MRPPLRFAGLCTFFTRAFSLTLSAQNYVYLTSGALKYVSVINTSTTPWWVPLANNLNEGR